MSQPIRTPDEFFTAEYYVKHNTGGHFDPKTSPIRKHSMMFRTFALSLARKVTTAVDVGGGRGEMSRHLAECGARVIYMDYSSAACEIARYACEGLGVEIVNGSGTQIAQYVSENSADLIFSNQCIQYLDEAQMRAFIQDAARILRPGGHLVFNSPERKRGVEDTQQGLDAYAKRYWNGDEMQAALAEAFPHAESFTWDGFERFDEPGKFVMLFGVGSKTPYEELPFATTEGVLNIRTDGDWDRLRFVTPDAFDQGVRLEFTVEGHPAAGTKVAFQVVLTHSQGGAAERYHGMPREKFDGTRRRIMLPTTLFSEPEEGEPMFDTFELRARADAGNAGGTIRVTDVRAVRTAQ